MQSLRRSGYVLKFSDRNAQKKPRPLGRRGESLRLLAVWGTLIHRPCVPDASASDCKSMFCEGDGQHKKACFKDSKAAGGTQPAALPSSPIRAVSTAPVGSSDHAAFASNPSAQERGRPVRPERLPVGRRLFCDFESCTLGKRQAPTGVCRGLVSPTGS